MLNLSDKKLLFELIAEAIAEESGLAVSAPELQTRIKTIAEAAVVLTRGETLLFHRDPFENALYFKLPNSSRIFRATAEECNLCHAFCAHRVLCRLAEKYEHLTKRPPEELKLDFAEAVFFDPELAPPQKIKLLEMCVADAGDEVQCLIENLQPS